MTIARSFCVGLLLAVTTLGVSAQTSGAGTGARPRARDLGIPFVGSPGKLNAITDVAGVEVGYVTLVSGEGKRVIGRGPIRTGVTAILPRGKASGDSVFAAYFSGNGNGDMTGTHWVEESGVLETPIVITNTLSVGIVRDATVDWMVKRNRPGPFWYPVVAETSDGRLNDMKGQHVSKEHTMQALNSAQGGAIAEGNVGGGTGMVCNGFKGGTGTSSRQIENAQGGYTVGVLVQCNYGSRSGVRIAGVLVGNEIQGHQPCVAKLQDPRVLMWNGQPAPLCETKAAALAAAGEAPEDGSIIVVVATDAPLTPDQLKRVSRRVALGLGGMGGIMGNGSGDIFIAFSTANAGADDGNSTQPSTGAGSTAQRPRAGDAPSTLSNPAAVVQRLRSEQMDPLFLATVQATEEAITNAMIAAETMTGADYWRYYAIPHDELQRVLRKYNRLHEKR